MGIKSHSATPTAALALGLFFTPPASIAIDAIINTVASLVPAAIGNLGLISPAMGQPGTVMKKQSDALNTYNNALRNFESILGQRRAQINSNQRLPNLPGQALYLARNSMISAYKDLTDALPSKIGGPNKFGIPPAYFDAGIEPQVDEYRRLFDLMEAPPINAQKSDTPFKDVVDLGIAIARAKGLDATNAEAAGRISLGLFFAETNGNQNVGNARSNRYKGSLQTGPSEDQNGRKKWAAIKKSIAAFDPALNLRDDREEARVGNLDHRLNHWTAVRDALMNAHADIFPQVTAIMKTLPNPIDQMKLFELIQIIPTPTRSALRSGNLVNYEFPTRRSWDICETIASSPLDKLTGQEHLQPSAKFLMRCGSSMKSLNERCPNSTRSRRGQRAELGWSESDARWGRHRAIRAHRGWPIEDHRIPSRPP